MGLEDARGLELSGATPRTLERYEAALAAHLAFRGDAVSLLAPALEEAPAFAKACAMAKALAAYLALGGRDPAGAAAARGMLERAARLPMNARERAHIGAIAALADGCHERAAASYGAILAAHPRDVLALGVAHACDYLRGDTASLHGRVARALGAWHAGLPGYSAVLAMYAFGLEETGRYAPAEALARRALELDPRNVRAHHAVAHVHEMRGEAAQGIRWAEERRAYWDDGSAVAVHNWWHVALFQLALGQRAGALAIYDARIRPAFGRALSVLIDASALLWRIELSGGSTGGRWGELAERWAPHAQDAYCAFSDLHAMMAFAAAGRRASADALLAAQRRRILGGGINETMTRVVGLPACRALRAFGEGRYREAAALLAALPLRAHRLGGSRAQQGVIALTLDEAARRVKGRAFLGAA
jgi:tetratricopeptide (TPR) repeat protein